MTFPNRKINVVPFYEKNGSDPAKGNEYGSPRKTAPQTERGVNWAQFTTKGKGRNYYYSDLETFKLSNTASGAQNYTLSPISDF